MSFSYQAYVNSRNAAGGAAPAPGSRPAPQPAAAAANSASVPSINPVHSYQYVARTGVPVANAAYPYPYPVQIPVPVPQPDQASNSTTTMPTYYPAGYYGYPYYPVSYPSWTAAPGAPVAASNPFQAQTSPRSTHHLWSGRTRAEVERDDAQIRRETAAAAKAATDKFKPAAEPHDQFWVIEADGVTKNLMTFATINTFKDGRWMLDGTDGIAYYWRGHPLPPS